MRALPGVLDGTVVFETTPQRDDNGSVALVFDAEAATAVGIDPRGLVQESQWRSSRGAVRGLYVHPGGGEGKLVRCSHGAVLDVSVDLRPDSPTYRLWMTLVLDDVEHRSAWLPPGLAHGFQALTATADLCCRSNRGDRPERDAVIRPDDVELAIPWPLPVRGLSERELTAPSLAVVEPMLSEWFGPVR